MLWAGTVKNSVGESWQGSTLRFEDLIVNPGSVIGAPPLIACVELYGRAQARALRSFQIGDVVSKADFHFTRCLESASELYFSVHHLPREWGRKLEANVPLRSAWVRGLTREVSALVLHSVLNRVCLTLASCLLRQLAHGWEFFQNWDCFHF